MMRFSADLDHYLESVLGPARQSPGDERAFECPHCGKSNLWINVKKLVVHCWTCPYGMSLRRFLSEFQHISMASAQAVLQRGGHGPYTLDASGGFSEMDAPDLEVVDLGWWAQTFQDPIRSKTRLGRKAYAYLTKPPPEGRGLDPEVVLRYFIRYAEEGRYRGRVLIPIVEDPEIVYFVARDFLGRDKKYKYLNPRPEEIRKKAGQVLFNFDRARRHSPVVLVEGVFDAISVGSTAMAMLGKTLSAGQRTKLVDANVKHLLIIGDRDVSIQEKQAQNARLARIFESVRWTPPPAKKDPGDMTRREIAALLNQAQLLQPGLLGSQPFPGNSAVRQLVARRERRVRWTLGNA